MDNGFNDAAYPGYTLAELRARVADGRGTALMQREVIRREAVAGGNVALRTRGERLRAAAR